MAPREIERPYTCPGVITAFLVLPGPGVTHRMKPGRKPGAFNLTSTGKPGFKGNGTGGNLEFDATKQTAGMKNPLEKV